MSRLGLPVASCANLAPLISKRETGADFSPISARVHRAAGNLYESLPIFLALALLSIHYQGQHIPSYRLASVQDSALRLLRAWYNNASLAAFTGSVVGLWGMVAGLL
ncbi:MAG: hypothetical protein OSA42_08650 [Porticoccaceae bacterium]|nr:hypothetical protein [Porticoccaceae bacterium]